LIGGTKGSHIVVDPFPGAPMDALYAEARQDGRPFFIIPWNNLYLIGTTDTRYTGDLDRVEIEDWEIDLLLGRDQPGYPGREAVPGKRPLLYAGIRPLPNSLAESEGAITRRHIVYDHGLYNGPRGLLSIVGGKLTTYRELAEQTVDLVARSIGRACR
jgi:glycerol-3-phosphate dehydrogenase